VSVRPGGVYSYQSALKVKQYIQYVGHVCRSMRLPLSATQKRRDTPTVFRPSELPKAVPKWIIFQVWCAHGREYWGDGLSDVTPCILVNTNALEESAASVFHPEAGDNTALKKVDYYVLEVALSVQVEYPTHVVRLPGGSSSFFSTSFRPAMGPRGLLWDLVQVWEANQSLRQITAIEHITSQNVVVTTGLHFCFSSFFCSNFLSQHVEFLIHSSLCSYLITSLLSGNILQEW